MSNIHSTTDSTTPTIIMCKPQEFRTPQKNLYYEWRITLAEREQIVQDLRAMEEFIAQASPPQQQQQQQQQQVTIMIKINNNNNFIKF